MTETVHAEGPERYAPSVPPKLFEGCPDVAVVGDTQVWPTALDADSSRQMVLLYIDCSAMLHLKAGRHVGVVSR